MTINPGGGSRAQLAAFEIRAVQLGVLDRVLEWCEVRDLTCYAAYGTLLGARRHSGYIPWDDDIDIMIPRSHYELLRNVPKVGELVVGGHRGDKDWPYSNVKVYDPSTLITGDGPFDAEVGVGIDVFPVDEPFIGAIGVLQSACIRALVALLALQALMPRPGRSAPARLAAAILPPVAALLPRTRLLRALDAVASRRGNAGRLGVVVGSYQWTVPATSLGSGATMSFENRLLPVPEEADIVLTALYGRNFMTPPPLGQQHSHHTFTAFRQNATTSRESL
ncbi:LicD family protein [Janibacter cremeus]|uniref:Lipopolysaccharide cholinephosphotransferase n=1 Tax=Janibacter cremeus TaxID=1285192 RepID=A0A852VJZ7_9MICO|nr:lipopolysaccharide cholinephosphotransferase [Janibacter cremeus]